MRRAIEISPLIVLETVRAKSTGLSSSAGRVTRSSRYRTLLDQQPKLEPRTMPHEGSSAEGGAISARVSRRSAALVASAA
jgi:hypothetical protein